MLLRKLLPLMICAMIGFAVLGSKPAHAQTIFGSIGQSGSYFVCNLTGYWIDSIEIEYIANVYVDGNFVEYVMFSPPAPDKDGVAAVALSPNQEVGNLAYGYFPGNPSFTPLSPGTHSCEITVVFPGVTLFDTGLVYYTF